MAVTVLRSTIFLLATLLFLGGCAPRLGPVTFHAQDNPPALSDWQLLQVRGDHLALNDGVRRFTGAEAGGFHAATQMVQDLSLDGLEVVLVQGDGELDFGFGAGENVGFHSLQG